MRRDRNDRITIANTYEEMETSKYLGSVLIDQYHTHEESNIGLK